MANHGVESRFVWLGDHYIERNGHKLMLEDNSEKIFLVILECAIE